LKIAELPSELAVVFVWISGVGFSGPGNTAHLVQCCGAGAVYGPNNNSAEFYRILYQKLKDIIQGIL
jgi:hypothetical protein